MKKRLKQPYEATESMELLYDQIEDAIEFADNAQQPYSPEQVLRIGYNLIFKRGEFERECESGQKSPQMKNEVIPDT